MLMKNELMRRKETGHTGCGVILLAGEGLGWGPAFQAFSIGIGTWLQKNQFIKYLRLCYLLGKSLDLSKLLKKQALFLHNLQMKPAKMVLRKRSSNAADQADQGQQNSIKRPKRAVTMKHAMNAAASAPSLPENGEGAICWIESLPPELLVHVFDYLDFPQLLRAELVSRKWPKMLREEGWRHFSQCRLTKKFSPEKVATLFRRCGPHLRELVLGTDSPEDKSSLPPAREVLLWLHLLPRLDSISIAERPLALPVADFPHHSLRCLQLEGCFDKLHHNFGPVRELLAQCTQLRYISLAKSRMPIEVANCAIPAKGLRHLKLDDSFDLGQMLREGPEKWPELVGLSLDMNKKGPQINFLTSLDSELLLQRLQQFELSFAKKMPDPALAQLRAIVPWFANLRVLSLARIDGKILTKIVRHCAQLEQFDYRAHSASILEAFPRICQLQRLRVLWIKHYEEAKPRETPEVVRESLRELASLGRLERLTLNTKLPMELVLHIVGHCPSLDYLEYDGPPSDIRPLIDAVEETRKGRPNCRPLHFRTTYQKWWNRRFRMRQKERRRRTSTLPPYSAWFKLRHQELRRETSVMSEHWHSVFDGDTPQFLVRWPREEDAEL